jgi:hypothetical protein
VAAAGQLGAFDETEEYDLPPSQLRTPAGLLPDDAAAAAAEAATGAPEWQAQHRAAVTALVRPAHAAGPVRAAVRVHCTYTTEQGREERYAYTAVITFP